MNGRPILIDLPEELAGERVVLRPLREADAGELYAAVQESIPRLKAWMPWYDQHGSVEDSLAYIRRTRADRMVRESFDNGIFSASDGSYLGNCGLHPRNWAIRSFEIGYWIRTSAEGHGYVSEATRLLTRFAFDELDGRRVMIRCDSRNERSKAVAERLGYMYEGCLRNAEPDPEGIPRDALIYAMIPKDYAAAQARW